MKIRFTYIPGSISLIFLPILCYWFLQSRDYFTQLRAVEFTSMDFEELEKLNEGFDLPTPNEFDKRVYKEVVLNGSHDPKKTFQYIDTFVHHVIQNQDTINGLKIHLKKGATYNDFIKVLNIFSERKAILYLLDQNTLYFVGRDIPKETGQVYDEIMPFTCGWYDYQDSEPSTKEKINMFFKNGKVFYKNNSLIFNAYFLLTLGILFFGILQNQKKLKQ